MPDEVKTIDAELVPVENSALQAITKGEIDIQIATAHKFPRSIELFKKRGIEMACIDEETAASCLYSRPVGTDADGKQKYAEGMSVRMAEIVAACYGNIRFGAMIIEQTPRYVKCRGFAHDLEANSAGSSEVIEATVKKPRAGQKEGDPYDERMRIVIAKAALAKARRDAIFQVVPRALAKPLEAAVRKLLTGDEKSITRRRAIVMKWIADLKIDSARVFHALGIKGEADLSIEILEKLTGLRTAINDGDVTLDEAFPPIIGNARVGGEGATTTPTPGQTSSEAAANAGKAATSESSAPAGKTQESKPKEPAGPTVAELKKSITNRITARGFGKTRLVSHLVEKKVIQEGAKWDDFDHATLVRIDESLDEYMDEIAPPK